MNDSNEALKLLFAQPTPAPIVGEYERERLAALANFERLKQQRREREASINPK
jgi:hypothetical protein